MISPPYNALNQMLSFFSFFFFCFEHCNSDFMLAYVGRLTIFYISTLHAAWRNGPSGLPIFAEGFPKKLADPFDFGGGIVNPNGATDPGLVYDVGATDHIHYLCAVGYNNSAISQLTGQSIVCPSERPSILDVNLPSITIPNLRNSTTLTRTVTNVGAPESIYRVVIQPPIGVVITVNPDVLVFNSMTKSITFKVTVSSTHHVNTGYYFGSLTWTDGVHEVRSPLSVRTEIIQSYVDDN